MRLWILPALAVLLGACDRFGNADLPPTSCPRITILAEGADLTRFRPGAGQDLSVMVADARVQALNARCDYGNRGRTVEVQLTVGFQVERGPAASGPVTLPWFVIVTNADDESVIQRRAFAMGVSFPANVSRTTSTSPTLRFSFPVGEGRRVTDYNVRISFQLTEEELAYNRRRGTR